MSTELAELPVAKDGILISVTEERIAEMASQFSTLKINGIADKEGWLKVDNARKECKKARGVIKDEHETLKADALKVCQTLDAMKRTLTGKIEAIEYRLIAELQAVEDEKARIEKEKQDKIYAARQVAWNEVGGPKTDRAYLMQWNDDRFGGLCREQAAAKAAREEAAAKAEADRIERERLAAEQAEANRIESERLAAERAELDRQKAEQEAAAAKLKADQDRLAKIEQDRLDAERLETARLEAAEKARVETEQRLEREAKAREAERVAKEAADKRAADLLPVKQKLENFAHGLRNIQTPDLDADVERKLYEIINAAADQVVKLSKDLA